MNFYDPMKPKKSLGVLRRASKTKPRSPDFTGKIALQRHTMEMIFKQFNKTKGDEIQANIAGWANSIGQSITVELSPLYLPKQEVVSVANLDFVFNDQEENN